MFEFLQKKVAVTSFFVKELVFEFFLEKSSRVKKTGVWVLFLEQVEEFKFF